MAVSTNEGGKDAILPDMLRCLYSPRVSSDGADHPVKALDEPHHPHGAKVLQESRCLGQTPIFDGIAPKHDPQADANPTHYNQGKVEKTPSICEESAPDVGKLQDEFRGENEEEGTLHRQESRFLRGPWVRREVVFHNDEDGVGDDRQEFHHPVAHGLADPLDAARRLLRALPSRRRSATHARLPGAQVYARQGLERCEEGLILLYLDLPFQGLEVIDFVAGRGKRSGDALGQGVKLAYMDLVVFHLVPVRRADQGQEGLVHATHHPRVDLLVPQHLGHRVHVIPSVVVRHHGLHLHSDFFRRLLVPGLLLLEPLQDILTTTQACSGWADD
mmetsp:Transcript_33836/g.97240  ORF Transcript_33836/g.97240 Transcript_33836/m.97240 type:complete len:331 (+) Transcript_33836:835-1827(+)